MKPNAPSPIDPTERALLAELRTRIAETSLRDEPGARRLLSSAAERLRRGQPADNSLIRAEALLTESLTRVEARRKALPEARVMPDLPIAERWEDLLTAVREHPVVIVAGETGSGKTTQLPKLALELGRGLRGTIGCTQPRRIAALSMARRLREELRLGSADSRVGHKVRFDTLCDKHTLIKFMTDGMLLAETRGDRQLLEYDTLIIDEAHERSLNIDFLLGYTKQLLRKRQNLKVIISSATLDVERFSTYFDNAPVVQVSGRTFPVEVLYHAPEREDSELSHEVARAVDDLMSLGEQGDILVFLAGEGDIQQCSRVLSRRLSPERFEVLPLLARLPSDQQRRVFHPGARRRVILATNVAETSLTLPRIRYVVDSGVARLSRYNHRTGVQRLHIEPVSQASANQRKGRCGRIAPGICIRLYSEADFEAREPFTPPEIKRSSLASVILAMDDLRLGTIDTFPFVEPPLPTMIQEGYRELQELQAADADRRVTRLGHALARFPIAPRFARMLLAARDEGVLEEVLTIVSGLTVDDPRQRPIESRDAADALHARFHNAQSDFGSLLKLWAFWQEAQTTHRSRTRQRHFCHDNFLALRRMQEWRNVRDQLKELCREMKAPATRPPRTGTQRTNRGGATVPLDTRILKSLLVGLLSKVGSRTEEGDYRGAHGTRFRIHPGSGLAKKRSKPEWLMAAELVDTTRLYARCAATIDPAWLEPLAAHVCRYSYGQPYWDAESGFVRAPETVLLYGLTLIEGRQRHFGPIDPPLARRIFIEDGLVPGQLKAPVGVIRENVALLEELRALQERLRRRDMLVDDAIVEQFYEERLPAEVYSVKGLQRWLDRTHAVTIEGLRLPRDLLLARPEAEQAAAADENFPTEVRIGEVSLTLSYCYDRASECDGITCTLPAESLPLLEGWRHDWLVPGALQQKVEFLLRGLPKRIRRILVPVPRTVEQFLASSPDLTHSLLDALTQFIRAEHSLLVTADLWPAILPPYLLMRFSVVDAQDHVLATSRDLKQLRQQVTEHEARTVASNDRGASAHQNRRQHGTPKTSTFQSTGTPSADNSQPRWPRDGMRSWTCEPLPESVNVGSVAVPIYHYPAMIDQNDSVGVECFPHSERARRHHKKGLLRLYLMALEKPLRALGSINNISPQAATALAVIGGNARQLAQDIAICAVSAHTLDGRPLPRNREAFNAPVAAATASLYATARDLTAAVDTALQKSCDCLLGIEQQRSPAKGPACDDMAQQMRELLGEGFATRTPATALRRLPTYLAAIAIRLERLKQGALKDAQRLETLIPYRDRCLEILEAIPESLNAEAIADYRWLLEEWRISLFAQELGTATKVSAKRLDKAWDKAKS